MRARKISISDINIADGKLNPPSEAVCAPFINELIAQALVDDNLTSAILAHRLDRSYRTIRALMSKHSVPTAMLWEVCHALKRNLFADIAATLPEDYASDALDAMRARLEEVTKERDILLRSIGEHAA